MHTYREPQWTQSEYVQRQAQEFKICECKSVKFKKKHEKLVCKIICPCNQLARATVQKNQI